MAEETVTIKTLLEQLREPRMGNKKIFDDFLPEAQKTFGLGDDLDTILLDAFLIQAIMHCVFGSKDEPAEIDKAHAVKRDTYLLALGLLQGYYHTKDDGSHYMASERHKQYLTDSDYMKLSKFKPSDNLDIEYAQSVPRRRLSTADNRCRKDLVKTLTIKRTHSDLLEEGKERYIKKNENGEKYIDLPKPRYSLENFLPIGGNSGSDPNLTGNLADEEEIGQKEREQPQKKKKHPGWIIVAIGSIIALFILVVCNSLNLNVGFSVNTQLQTEKPPAINQYQEEDPFSPQRLDFNFGIDINFSVSSSIDNDENREPVVNDAPIPEPTETGSE